tara:strand:+ start:3509 stop:4174 length:666 start_codon:yes stop_codon:yes gene_type:complete
MNLNINGYDNFIFDCDGVILDSNSVKSEIFYETLSDENESYRKQFIEYHHLNTGISRYRKFDYYFSHIKKQNDYKKELDFLLKRFSSLLYEKFLKCSLTKGVEDLLQYLNQSDKNVVLVSASDEIELISIFKQRSLDKYFNTILGSPKDKIMNIKSLVSIENNIDKSIFFGDSKSDYDAAKYFKIDFVFISRYSMWKVPENIKKCREFIEIEDFSKICLNQ